MTQQFLNTKDLILENEIKNYIIDFKFFILRIKWLIQYKLQNTSTQELLIYRIINQLSNFYSGKRSYKASDIVDNFMKLQENMIVNNGMSFKMMVTNKIIVDDVLITNEMVNDCFDISRSTSMKIRNTFHTIYQQIEIDNYLNELEIETIIRDNLKVRYGK